MTPAERAAATARFETALGDPRAAQEALLRTVLAALRTTEYGRTIGADEIRGLDDLRRRAPLMTGATLYPLAERMLAGERDVLVPGLPKFFARTSGTSGKPKHIPYVADVRDEFITALGPLLDSMEHDHPGTTRHAMNVTGRFVEGHAPCGIPVGSASGFVRAELREEPFFQYAPTEVFDLTDFDARYYALLRYALPLPIRALSALNPSTLLLLFSKATAFADALADDLARGTLSAGPAEARSVEPFLGRLATPDAATAERLRASVRAHGRFVPEEVWPQLSLIQTWKGGASSHYMKQLSTLCPRSVIRAALSGSSEGPLFVPLRDDWAGGVPALNSCVFEFFPAVESPAPEDALDASALRDGGEYRLALTNRRLVRFLMDDVHVVEGRHRGVPVLRFSHRFGITSSLTGEKLTEPDVQHAIAAFEAPTLGLVDYQLAPEWDDPPRYVLLVELARGEHDALPAALQRFERALCESNGEYRGKRDSGRLAAPELLVLPAGGFEAMRRALVTPGRSDAQVKVPKLSRTLVSRRGLAATHTARLP